MREAVLTIAAVANLTLIDAIVKRIASALFSKGAVSAIDGFFNLAYVENRGCAWGMLQGQAWPLAAFGAVALAFIVWKRRTVFALGPKLAKSRKAKWAMHVAEVLLYSGILGNLIDRVAHGYVIDMFDFHCGASHFPCFNMADSYITVSVAILIACSLFGGDAEKAEAKAAKK